MMFAQRQQGVALVTALLVVSIAAVLASTLVDRLHLDIRRTENLLHNEQAYIYAIGLEEFVRIALKADRELNEYDDNIQLAGANQYLIAPVEGGQVTGQLIDLQSRINLNNLSKSNPNQQQAIEMMQKLLENLQLDKNLVHAINDWIDKDQITDNPQFGAEYDYYIGLQPAYRSADTMMSSPSELRLVKGFNTDDIFEKLSEFITTLPEVTTINVNTAPREVLESIKDIETGDADRILARRDGNEEDPMDGEPFEKQDDFKSYMQNELKKNNFSIDGLATSSDYFLLTTTSIVGHGRVRLYSILHRDDKGNTSVISRSQGTW